MFKVELMQGKRSIVLWDSWPDSEFELDCLRKCIKAGIEMTENVSHEYGRDDIYMTANGEMIDPYTKDLKSFKEWFKDKFVGSEDFYD